MIKTLLTALSCLSLTGCSWPVQDVQSGAVDKQMRLERDSNAVATDVLTYWDTGTPDSATKRLSEFRVPPFASLRSATVRLHDDGSGSVVFELGDAMPAPSGDRLVLEAHLESEDGSAVVALYLFDAASLNTAPPLNGGDAALVSLSDGEVLARASVNVSGNTVTLTFDGGLQGMTTLYLAVARFLPENIPIERVAGGFSTCWTECLTPKGPQPSIRVPDLPGVGR